MPGRCPSIVDVPPMNYVAVRGHGDPNEEGGDYQRALGILYPVAFTLRMSYRGDHRIDGFFEYVVPPLEGFWTMDAGDPRDKSLFQWISVIRLPDFVGEEDLRWATEEAEAEKGVDPEFA